MRDVTRRQFGRIVFASLGAAALPGGAEGVTGAVIDTGWVDVDCDIIGDILTINEALCRQGGPPDYSIPPDIRKKLSQ